MSLITVDFDNTLTLPAVQKFVFWAIGEGYEIKILTSRFDDTNPGRTHKTASNDPVFLAAKLFNIPRSSVIFTNMQPKFSVIEKMRPQPVLHLDDDRHENGLINHFTPTISVFVSPHNDWETKAKKALKWQQKSQNHFNQKKK